MLPIFTHTTKGKESDESQFFSLWEHDKFTDAHTLQWLQDEMEGLCSSRANYISYIFIYVKSSVDT